MARVSLPAHRTGKKRLRVNKLSSKIVKDVMSRLLKV